MNIRQHIFRTLTMSLLIVGGLLVGLPQAITAADSQWQAQYFNNRTLSGDPLITISETEINHDWGDNTPFAGIDKDAFSVRWKRTVSFASSGVYRFAVTTDDGMRVFLDDTKILDSWTDSQVHTVTADVYVNAGDHRLQVEYYEAGGKAVARFSFAQLSAGSPGGTTPVLNWRGEYFNNTSLSGSPAVVRDDSQINFNWGVGSPAGGIAADNFSVRWSRTVSLNAGKYRFTTTADDGVRLWINNVLVLDQWRDQARTTTHTEVTVAGGSIPIILEYYEHVGDAAASLTWTQLSGSTSPPPAVGIWTAEYFNNRKLEGTPLSTRTEQAIDFNWGYGSPVPNVINVDNFSARWTATLNLPAGRYRFTARSDDGIRIWVNSRLVVDFWADRAVGTSSGEIDLPGGAVPVKVEYFDHALLAEAHVSWTQIRADVPPPIPSGAWLAEFFNNLSLSGPPLVVRSDQAIDFNWGYNSPIPGTIDRDDFSVRWTGSPNLPAGRYRFTSSSDDGLRVWVNSRLVIDSWSDHPLTPASAEVEIPGGATPIKVEYYDNRDLAEVHFAWTQLSGGGQPISGYTAVVNTGALNVRSGPGVANPAFTYVGRGTRVTLIGVRALVGRSTWVQIQLADGRQGWVNAFYLRTAVDVNQFPLR